MTDWIFWGFVLAASSLPLCAWIVCRAALTGWRWWLDDRREAYRSQLEMASEAQDALSLRLEVLEKFQEKHAPDLTALRAKLASGGWAQVGAR